MICFGNQLAQWHIPRNDAASPTFAAVPTPAQLMMPPNKAPVCFVHETTCSTTSTMSVFHLRDIQFPEFQPARRGSNGSCVGLIQVQDGDVSFLLKDASDTSGKSET
jgi:hypothetical protein